MMRRRLLAWILAAAMVLLAGCGGGGDETTKAPGADQETTAAQSGTETTAAAAGQTDRGPQKIVVWHSMTDDAGILMDQFVKDFNEGPGKDLQIEVEAVFQGSYSDSSTKLRTILQNEQYDQLPDVIQIDATGIVDYKNCEYAFTVDDALKSDAGYDMGQFMNAPLKAWNFGNIQYGMPFPASTTVMYYNKTVLDNAQVMEAPTTFEEITAAAARS